MVLHPTTKMKSKKGKKASYVVIPRTNNLEINDLHKHALPTLKVLNSVIRISAKHKSVVCFENQEGNNMQISMDMAMEQLREMFPTFDDETFRDMLIQQGIFGVLPFSQVTPVDGNMEDVVSALLCLGVDGDDGNA